MVLWFKQEIQGVGELLGGDEGIIWERRMTDPGRFLRAKRG